MPGKTNCTLRFEPITVDTISRIINDLKPKTSTGVDSVSNKLLKFVKNVISEPLSIIYIDIHAINEMLKSGIFLDSLKNSKIIPLYKKDDDTIYQIIDLFDCYLPYLKFLKGYIRATFHIFG